MKLLSCLSVVVFLILINGCTERYRDINYPDIKTMRTDKLAFKFDIQEFKKKYGEPPIIDKENKMVGYYCLYKLWYGNTFLTIEPKSMEYWYLLLTPTEDANYFTGERYSDYFRAINSKGSDRFTEFKDVKPLKDIEKIKKCELVKPDYYYDKTKAINYSSSLKK